MSEYYSNDLGKEINESFEELQSDYKENSSVVPEFLEFVKELKPRLNTQDALKLDAFTCRISKVNRNALQGIEALYQISRNHRRLSTENLREIEEIQY